jgi:transposase
MMQDEMVHWLELERGVSVSRSTVCRLLKAEGWTHREIKRISRTQNQELRTLYKQRMRRYPAEDVIHLDESIFNEATGWRYRGYGPIGDEARYSDDIRRGKTWSICAVLTVDGLLCKEIRKGYFKAEDFLAFIEDTLIPAMQAKYQGRPVVVVMDNCSSHINRRVEELLEEAGHLLQYLPPYSPDFNPIELVWSVLKAWIRRWYYIKRRGCRNFRDFLEVALTQSECDRFARKQYRHTAGGIYLEREEYEAMFRGLREYEVGGDFEDLRPAEEAEFEEDMLDNQPEDEELFAELIGGV